MGKGILILVLGTTIAGGVVMMSKEKSRMANTAEEARYEEAVLAREAAQSAFNIVVGRVKRDFESYRSVQTAKPYGAATYDISAQEDADGNVEIVAIGKYGDFEHQIEGTISRGGDRVLDAITFNAVPDKISFKNDYLISGLDRDIDGSVGRGPDVHGILTTTAEIYESVSKKAKDEHVIGVDGEADVILGEPHAALASIESKILSYDGPALQSLSGKQKWKTGDSMGSVASPVMVRVTGNVELESSFSGVGVLYVYGDLSMEGSASWTGLVYVADAGAKFSMIEDASIVGSVIIQSSSGLDVDQDDAPDIDGDKGLIGGHFDVDIFDEDESTKEISHVHRYDDKYDVKGINLLEPGCGSRGMCWSNVFSGGEFDDVKLQFFNQDAADGTYTITASGITYTGNISSGLDLKVDPTEVTLFKVDFNTMCALAPSKPSSVQNDAEFRDGGLSIRAYDGGDIVYEVAVYHHWNEGECSDTPGKADEAKDKKEDKKKGKGGKKDEVVAVDVTMEDDVRIQYSSEAVRMLKNMISEIEISDGGFTVNKHKDSGRVKTGYERYKDSIR